MDCKFRCKKWPVKWDDFAFILKFISVGKHNQGLFLNGRRQYSTWIGGLVTLIFAFIMILFTISTLKSTINRDQYLLTYSQQSIDESSKVLYDTNIYDLEITLWRKYYLILDQSYHKSCSEIEVFVTINQFNGSGIITYNKTFEMEQIMI